MAGLLLCYFAVGQMNCHGAVVILSAVFSFIVVFLNSSQSYGTLQCIDVFARAPVSVIDQAQRLTPFDQLRSQLAPGEIPEHGNIVWGHNRQGLQNVLQIFQVRDGTYPLIIDSTLNIAIDHRLPDPNVSTTMDFVGTHRGLYNKLSADLGKPASVIFAGQIRVVGGTAINLIDQAGTFYDVAQIPKSASSEEIKSRELKLIESNQQRLDFAQNYLISLGIIAPPTKVINFRRNFSSYDKGSQNEGHIKARHAAEFERNCRAQPECWSHYKKMQPYVRWVMARGGLKYISDHLHDFMQKDMTHGTQAYQVWTYVLAEGLVDTMSFRNMLVPGTQLNSFFLSFIEHSSKLLDIELPAEAP